MEKTILATTFLGICSILFGAVDNSLLAADSNAGPPADPLDSWHWRNPLPAGASIHSVTWVNGQFLAVGWSKNMFTSPDGVRSYPGQSMSASRWTC